MLSPQPIRRSVSCISGSRSSGTSSVMFLPAASAARVSEQPLRRRVPAGDGAVERRRDDGVVGGFDRRAEQPLPLGMMVARRHGAAMLLDLLLERGGLCIHFLDRLRKRAREHAGLAACIDRNGDLALAGHPLNGFGQPHDRPGQRPRDQHRQHGRAQHRDRADQKRGIPDARSRRHDHGVGGGFDDADPFGAGQKGRREGYPAGPGGSDPERCPRCLALLPACDARCGKSAFQSLGLPSNAPNSRERSG